MSKRIFQIDYDRLVLLCLPTFLRKNNIVSFLRSVIVAIKYLYVVFRNNQNANLYKLAHNGQVCYLRKVLNDTFDPGLRRIKIVEGLAFAQQYIYTSAEQQKKYLGTMYLRQSTDYADTGVDFRVVVPDGYDLSSVIHQMKSMVDYYKLTSKRYKIQHENE